MGTKTRFFAAVTLATIVIASGPAHASRTLTAPYAAAQVVNDRCDECTEHVVIPDAKTGRVLSVTEVARPVLAGTAAVAATNGRITATTSITNKARTVRATAYVDVSRATATLFGATGSADRATGSLRIELHVFCSGCAGGARSVLAETSLVDADPTTATPSSASGIVAMPLSLTLPAGEKINGMTSISVESMTHSALGCSCLALSERRARVETDVRVSSIQVSWT